MSAAAAAPAPAHGFFPSRDGLQLYHEIWPARTEARATLLFVHGFGEHCRRYGWPISFFAEQGFDCVAFDYRGHGQASGTRGHCLHFEEYLGDLEAALALAAPSARGRPLFIVAHSHGALIALRYALGAAGKGAPDGPRLAGLALTSPYFGLELEPPRLKLVMARLLSRIAPRFSQASSIPAEFLSHEPQVVEDYKTDRWVHRVATARWFVESSRAQAYCIAHARALALPLLILQAGEDRIVSAAATRAFFDTVTVKDKRLIVYPGLHHEVLFEIERERTKVFADLHAWLQAHM